MTENPSQEGRTDMQRITGAVLAAAALTAVLAGCGPSTHSHPAASMLTGTAAVQVKQDITRCVPSGTIAQASYLHELARDTKAHPNGTRRQFFRCMGISKADEQPFLDAVLAAAETAGKHGQLSTKAGRTQFAEVTVPGIAARFITATPAPSATR